MTEQPKERSEAAYRFAVKLHKEGRLPDSRASDYAQQMAKLRREFAGAKL